MRHVALVAAVLASSCSAAPPHAAAPPSPVAHAPAPTPAAPAAPAPPATASYPGAPATAAGEHLAWVLHALATRQGAITRAEVDRRFHPSMLAVVSPDLLVQSFPQLSAELAGFTLVEVTGSELELRARIAAPSAKLVVSVVVDPATKQMTGLALRPDAAAAPKPASFEEAVTMTSALASKAQLLVASVERGTCKSLHATPAKAPLAIGSTAKLYVLLALVDQVLAGKVKWDDTVAIRDDWKSLPSGTTQGDPAGTQLTYRELATRMISISDNTATDHLLYTLGRARVETALRSTKHATPARNVPFLGTRELFLFKLGMPADEQARYLAMPERQRRAYLDQTLAGKQPDLAQAEGWTTARHIDQLEWFATTTDLCRAFATLAQRAGTERGKPLLEVLGKNPGVELDDGVFPYVGYKGGSEPGVVNLSWLVRRKDDRWFVVSLTANEPTGVVDGSRALGIASGVFELLAAEK